MWFLPLFFLTTVQCTPCNWGSDTLTSYYFFPVICYQIYFCYYLGPHLAVLITQYSSTLPKETNEFAACKTSTLSTILPLCLLFLLFILFYFSIKIFTNFSLHVLVSVLCRFAFLNIIFLKVYIISKSVTCTN